MHMMVQETFQAADQSDHVVRHVVHHLVHQGGDGVGDGHGGDGSGHGRRRHPQAGGDQDDVFGLGFCSSFFLLLT